MKSRKEIFFNIFGAGPTGLSLGYYAKKHNMKFRIYEKSNAVGGNCKTIKKGDFKFDTGAHRLHDKHNEVIILINKLLKNTLLKVNAPSQIYHEGLMINFPIEISDVIQKIGYQDLKSILKELFISSFKKKQIPNDFKQLAFSNYGETVSRLFLINYTEKLWGENAHNLSVKISGGRLRSHSISNLIKRILFKKSIDQKHLDGEFYYPKNGFGEIFESLKNQIGAKNINLNSPIEKIDHENFYITKFNNQNCTDPNINIFLNTLPLKVFIKCLNPAPPEKVLNSLNGIMFRDLKVCVMFLNIPRFSKNASIYYPNSKFPFTRIYEPKNRSESLAPEDKTCIVIEVPCTRNDDIYYMSDRDFFNKIFNCLLEHKLLSQNNLIDYTVIKMDNAYPIIKVGTEERLKPVFKYLGKIKNLYSLGRNADFKYMHTHEIFRRSKKLIDKLNKSN